MKQEKKYKVLLLMAYIDSMYEKIEEMGICYIVSVLRENGCQVLLIGKNERSIDYDSILAFNPDIIGITAYSTAKDSVAKIASQLKRQLPHAYICTGGYLPSLHNEEVLQATPSIDFGNFHFADFLTILSYYKRKFGGHDVHKKAYELIEANEKEINRMRTELNQSNAQWFRKLLALAKNGWSEKEADDISENYLNGKYIHTTLARIGRKKMELYLDLLRLDGGYDKYLIDIA